MAGKRPKKLTQIAVEAAKPKKRANGKLERNEISDGGSGLYLVVQPSRAKSYASRYRFKRQPEKLTHGPAFTEATPTGMTLAAARAANAQALHQVVLGIDPAAAKQAAKATSAEQEAQRAQDGVAKLFAQFIELYAKRRLQPETLRQYESVGRRFIVPTWRGRTIHQLKKRDVIDLTDRIAVDRPYMANRVLEVVHKFSAWLVARDVIAVNPAAGIATPGVEQARERFLVDGEIAALWVACDGDPIFGAAIRAMLLTGARRSEIAQMAWAEIDADTRVWTLPAERSKNKKAHVVPLSPLAWRIISAVPRLENCPHVFSTTGKGPIANFDQFKKRLDARLNLEPWRIHDLRRSCASGLQRLGVRLEVTEAVLGHRSGSFSGIVRVYQKYDYSSEKRAALERWSDHIEQITTGKSGKIVRLK
ncbi:MAG: tyrosine-type recombinase/integrase [Xanthobacteraceae bacterium]